MGGITCEKGPSLGDRTVSEAAGNGSRCGEGKSLCIAGFEIDLLQQFIAPDLRWVRVDNRRIRTVKQFDKSCRTRSEDQSGIRSDKSCRRQTEDESSIPLEWLCSGQSIERSGAQKIGIMKEVEVATRRRKEIECTATSG